MELTPSKVADQIYWAIKELHKEGERAEELVHAKANSIGEYDKALGVATSLLKAEGHPITLIDKIAKERTADLRIKMIVAEESLKAHYSKLSRLESQLNGFQSINRHLSHTVGDFDK